MHIPLLATRILQGIIETYKSDVVGMLKVIYSSSQPSVYILEFLVSVAPLTFHNGNCEEIAFIGGLED